MLVATGIFWFQSNPNGTWLMTSSEPLRKIYFETDGVLTEEWLHQYADIPEQATLREIDIFALQKSLLENGQTRQVTVERNFPDALRVTVREHVPLMRLVMMDAKGKKHLMVVSEEGVVYTGINYPRSMLNRLPFLIDVVLQRNDRGFKQIPGVANVSELLTQARTQYPHLYADWKFVSLKHFDGDRTKLDATLKIHTISSGTVDFKPENFEQQLQTLNAILLYAKYEQQWPADKIGHIDLTLSEPVLSMHNGIARLQ